MDEIPSWSERNSAFSPPNRLDLHSNDTALKWLHSTLPLSVQHQLRDEGILRFFADLGVLAIAPLVLSLYPSVIPRAVKLYYRRRTFAYGQHAHQTIDYYTGDHGIPCYNPNAPAVAFVHGGAWGSGRPWMYQLMVDTLLALGFSGVFMIGYRTWPTTGLAGQIADVDSALGLLHASRGFWDPKESTTSSRPGRKDAARHKPLILMGHSSGAHLVSLLVLRRASELRVAQPSHGSTGIHNLPDEPDTGSRLPLRCISAVVCLSAPYDLWRHHLFEASRGGHILSPMAGACGLGAIDDAAAMAIAAAWRESCDSVKASTSDVSPLPSQCRQAHERAVTSSSPAARPHQAPELAAALWHSSVLRFAQELFPHQASALPRFVLVHGTADVTVPWGQAATLATTLRSRGSCAVDTLWIHGMGHSSFVGLMLPPAEVLDAVLDDHVDKSVRDQFELKGGNDGEAFRLLSMLRTLAQSTPRAPIEIKSATLFSKL